MSMSHSVLSVSAAPAQVSRECAECEEEEKGGKLQRKAAGTAETAIGEAPSSVHAALRSQGQPLDAATRAFFEPRFGRGSRAATPLTENRYDFDGVRIHTGAGAAEAAREINGRAFTVGDHIVFGAGEYAPKTPSGQRQMDRELTHVIQQNRGPDAEMKTRNSIVAERLAAPTVQGAWKLAGESSSGTKQASSAAWRPSEQT